MKVAIASDDGVTISNHFGRTRGFVIYDISENGEITSKAYHENNHTHHMQHEQAHHAHEHAHGHGHGPVMRLLGDTQVVISRGMGRRILEDLTQAEIQPFIVDVREVEEAIEKYLADGLDNNLSRQCQH
jgi:predicted Fe-Mo cluster-binding NifX family protein